MTENEHIEHIPAEEPFRPGQLFGALKDGRISRRAFVVRAAALGFSASAINAFLIAYGGDVAATTPPAPAAAAPRAATIDGAPG